MNVKVQQGDLETTLNEILNLSKTCGGDLLNFQNITLRGMYDIVKAIPYVKDPDNVEVIKRPKYTFRYGGDCDCKVVIQLCHANLIFPDLQEFDGYGFALVGQRYYDHIFFILRQGKKIIDADATYPHNHFGLKKEYALRKDFIVNGTY